MESDDREERIDAMLTHHAIRQCATRYVRGADRHDDELLASAFWPDAQINYGSLFTGNRDAFVAWVEMRHSTAWVAHTHNITNQTIVMDGADAADVESYCVWLLRRADDTGVLACGRYIERYERRGGEWRILIRELITDVAFKAECFPTDPRFVGPNVGRWDREDLSYRHPMTRREPA